MKNDKKSIRSFFEHVTGMVPDVCAEIYYRFLAEQKPAIAAKRLQCIAEMWIDVNSDKTVEVEERFPEEEYKDTYEAIQPIVDKLILNLVKKNETPERFYSLLWESLTNEIMFPTDLDRICALLCSLLSTFTPYFQMVESAEMDDETFMKIGEEISQQVKQAIFALNREYKQRTQVADQLISIFKDLDSEEKKVVFVAKLLGYYQMRQQQLLERLGKDADLIELEEGS